jgi:predicted  nucleic acid-binding Zn-ribbon protein
LEGYEQKFQEKVKSLEQEIDTNSSTISEKIALIESLNAEIVEIESKNNELSAERDFNEKELLKMKNRFDFTVNVLKENMEANKEKINNFIQ